MAKILFYLLWLTAIMVVPMLLFCCAGCGPSMSKPHLVVFTADWCGKCQLDKPVISSIAATGRVEVRVIDADSDPESVQAYSVPSLPYYVVFVSGRKFWEGGDINVVYNYVNGGLP